MGRGRHRRVTIVQVLHAAAVVAVMVGALLAGAAFGWLGP